MTTPAILFVAAITSAAPAGIGMIGDGWDGPGANATTINFHFANAHPIDGQAQRDLIIGVLEEWASVVQIHFVEVAYPGASRGIEFFFATGNHCNVVPAECGAPEECTFNGFDPGRPGHAAYPPGITTECFGVSAEPYAGDVHFDAQEGYRTGPNQNGWSLELVAAHNIGHALGLQDNPNGSVNNVMYPFFDEGSGFLTIWEGDIIQIQQGYAAGVGSVTTLEDTGVWVNSNWFGPEQGTPGNPFNTVAEGVAGVPPFGGGVTVHVLGGIYPGSITIDKACIITSEFGTASIGEE